MMQSPSFDKLMRATSADAKHPVTVKLKRDDPTTLDSFFKKSFDLSDIEKLPEKPGAQNPQAITQGSVLAHFIAEQHEGALHPNRSKDESIKVAHGVAIKAENDFRKDLGQGTRKAPPNDETRFESPTGHSAIVVHFDDGHDEALLFDPNGALMPNPIIGADPIAALKAMGFQLP